MATQSYCALVSVRVLKGDEAISSKSDNRGFLALAAAGFALMASYGIVRPLARALFSFEARYMLWGMAATPLLVTLLIWPYSVAIRRYGPRLTVVACTFVSMALLALPLIIKHDYLTFFLYVWKDVYVVLLVEQFWSLANSMHSVADGKRRFGLLLFIGGLGAVAGNQMVALLAEPMGAWTVYQAAIAVLLPFAFFIARAHRWAPERAEEETPDTPKSGSSLAMLMGNPILVAVASIVALGQVMSGALEVVFTEHVATAFEVVGNAARDARAAYEGQFWTWVNLGSMTVQLATPFILARVSVRTVHMVVPATHVVAVVALLAFPSLTTAAFAFAWFKVLDYSLFRASKEVLYVPLGFDARYRVKMLIDMTIYRSSKGLSGLLLYGLSGIVASVGRMLSLAALLAVAAWGLFAWQIRRGFAIFEEEPQDSPVNDQDGGH